MLRQSARIAETQRASKERKAAIYSQINKAITVDEAEKRLADKKKRKLDDADEDTAAPQKKSLGYSVRLEPQHGKVEAIIVIPDLPPNMTVNVTVKGKDGKKVTQKSFQGYKPRLTVDTPARARTPSTDSSSDSDSVVEVPPPTSRGHIRNPQQHVQYPQQHFQHPQQHFQHPHSRSVGYGPGANVYRPGPGFYGPIAGPPPQVTPVSARFPYGAPQQPAYFGTSTKPPPQTAPVAAMLPKNAVQQPAYSVPQASPSAQYPGSPGLQLSPLTPSFYGYGPQAPYMQNPGMVGAQHPHYPSQSPGMWAPQTHPVGQPQWRPLGAAPLSYAPVQESVGWVPRPSTNAGEAPDSEPSSPASEGSPLTSPDSPTLI